MRFYTFFLSLIVAVAAMAAGSDHYTVIVSLDGFRWDYPEAFDTPFLEQYFVKHGVKAVMMPSFPSKTFPNHYTLATGLYPDHHGILANKFKIRSTGKIYSLSKSETRSDPQYYGGDPIWLTARRQGVITATVYWVGSDVPIKGGYANYWKNYQTKPLLTFDKRVNEVVRLLSLPEAERPHLVMAYFEEPDHAGHNNGPVTMATRRSVEHLDSLLSGLWHRIQSLPHGTQVNLIVTGDHGMTWLSRYRLIRPSYYLKDEWVERIDGDYPALITARKPKYVDDIVRALQDVPHLRAWKRGELPSYLHYGTHENTADVVVLPDVGWTFGEKAPTIQGSHGFDHTCSDMLVAFRAVGPDFKEGYVREQYFRNVCVYPLLAHLLGVEPSPNDGSLAEVQDLLR